MKIAVFDIDDTITNETEFLKKYAPEFLRKHMLDETIADLNGYNLGEIYGIQNQLIEKGLSVEEAMIESNKLINQFWNQYFLKYNCAKVKPGVSKFIKQLKRSGYNIYFISLRGRKTQNDDKGFHKFVRVKIVPFITKFMLRRNGIHADKIIIAQTEEEKLEWIKYYHPEVVFEDRVSMLEQIYNTEKDVHLVCVTSSHNEISELPWQVTRINDFVNDIGKLDFLLNQQYVENEKMTWKNKAVDFFQGYCFHIHFRK